MDYIKKFAQDQQSSSSQGTSHTHHEYSEEQSTSQDASHQEPAKTGFFGGLGDKLNSAAGGGRESEKKEDWLDKGVDMFQEKILKQGPQDNESAIEQAKDEQISDFIRNQYKGVTGKDVPIKDK